MKKVKRKFRIYAINILGVLLLALVPLVAPLPGPGGVPLILAGLKLLSINNPWADKFYRWFKKNGLSLGDILFPDNKKIQNIWDIILILAIALFSCLYIFFDLHPVIGILNSTIITTLVFGFFRNRRRFERILIKLKIIKNKS